MSDLAKIVVGGVALLASSCATQRREHPIVNMAVFDLNCPKPQLTYTQLDDKNWGVAGCGRRVRYVKVCRKSGYGMYYSEDCQWVANGSSGASEIRQ
jgi:hypothetical protein